VIKLALGGVKMRNVFFDDFFLFPDSILHDFFKKPIQSGFPVYDIFNEDKKTVIEYALAGYSADQISVSVRGTKLEVKTDVKRDENGPVRAGRRIVDKMFNHSFEAKGLDLENVAVSFVDGILRIEVPSLEPKEPEVKKLNIVTDKKIF